MRADLKKIFKLLTFVFILSVLLVGCSSTDRNEDNLSNNSEDKELSYEENLAVAYLINSTDIENSRNLQVDHIWIKNFYDDNTEEADFIIKTYIAVEYSCENRFGGWDSGIICNLGSIDLPISTEEDDETQTKKLFKKVEEEKKEQGTMFFYGADSSWSPALNDSDAFEVDSEKVMQAYYEMTKWLNSILRK